MTGVLFMQNSEPTSQAEVHRVHVGPADVYDQMSAMQFNLLTYLGLREDHYLLDIGCGSLRAGRLFVPYLKPGQYFGIEPEEWLLQEGIDKEVGRSMIELRRPSFSSNREFRLSVFDQKFDFIMAQSIFSHASEQQLRRCFSEAKTVMKPDAMFAATFFQGTKNYSGDEWAVKATYTLARMTELVEEAGLRCQLLDWPHADLQSWMLITHPDYRLELPEMTTTARVLLLEAHVNDLRRKHERLLNQPWTRLGQKLHVLQVFIDFKIREVLRLIRK